MNARSKVQPVRELIYTLKRNGFGFRAGLYRASDPVMDLTTGQKTATRSKIDIKQLVVLPIVFKQLTHYVNGFNYGGQFQVGDRQVLLDQQDLPIGYVLAQSDYFVIDGKRFDIVTYTEFDTIKGYHAIVRQTQGVPCYQIVDTIRREILTPVEHYECELA